MPEPERPFPPDVPETPTMRAALDGMVAREFLRSRKYQEQQWRASRIGAHSLLVDFEAALIGRFEKLGVPLFAHEFVRTAARQEELFKLGHSKARAGSSAHQYGLAVDIVHGIRAWGLDRKQWKLIGHVGKEVAAAKGIAIVWGGDWKFYDPAHWELRDWKQMKGGFPWPTM